MYRYIRYTTFSYIVYITLDWKVVKLGCVTLYIHLSSVINTIIAVIDCCILLVYT